MSAFANINSIRSDFAESRQRSAQRHNEHVLRAARRDRRQEMVCRAIIPTGFALVAIGFLVLLKAAMG